MSQTEMKLDIAISYVKYDSIIAYCLNLENKIKYL